MSIDKYREARRSAIDKWRAEKMAKDGYKPLNQTDIDRMLRLDSIRTAAEKPRFAKCYSESLVEILPPAKNAEPRHIVRYKRRRSGGKMS